MAERDLGENPVIFLGLSSFLFQHFVTAYGLGILWKFCLGYGFLYVPKL